MCCCISGWRAEASSGPRNGEEARQLTAQQYGQLSLLFNETEAYAAPPGPQKAKTTQVAAHTRKQSGSVKDVVPDNIPVEVVEHRLNEEERVCPQCGKVMREVLHADETTLQVLHEPGKKAQTKSYMWLYRTGRDDGPPIVLYEYQPSRKAEHAAKFLEGFSGYLHADGYQGYHKLSENIRVVGCWAHARRKFDEALNALPPDKREGTAALTGLEYCNQLFAWEERFRELSPEERTKQRLKEETPILDELLAWADSVSAAPKSALGEVSSLL